MRFITSFSGGKDSVLATHRMIESKHTLVGLMSTTKSESSWFHDINLDILKKVADALDTEFIPLLLTESNYTQMFEDSLVSLKEIYQLDAIVFGDIDIELHREWCENITKKAGLKAVFPLWQENRLALVNEFIDLGYQAMIKKVAKDKLDKSFLGKDLTFALLQEFTALNIDECGENGEYHTIVYAGPLFKNQVKLKKLEIEESDYTYQLNVALQ